MTAMYDELLQLLLDIDGVVQDRRYHPEGDALYHSLQVFEHALGDTDDWELLAAALLHDVGKALDSQGHAQVGASLLTGLMPPRVIWLVRHHLDLLRHPASTKRRLRGTRELADLQRLRKWDVAGRRPDAWVPPPERSLDILMNRATHAQRLPPSARPSAFIPADAHDHGEGV